MSGAPISRTAAKQELRRRREMELGKKIRGLPDKRYGVILADPPWLFETWSENGKDRSAENHYPCMEKEAIYNLPMEKIAAKDCVLFLWATSPMLAVAIDLIAYWGFTYRSNICWVKPKRGTGYWARNAHELLLIGTRGKVPCPAPGTQPDSVLMTLVPLGHSSKPPHVALMIDMMFPSLPKIELFCRGRTLPGWHAWGNEVLEKRIEEGFAPRNAVEARFQTKPEDEA